MKQLLPVTLWYVSTLLSVTTQPRATTAFILACTAFARMSRDAIAMVFVCLSVCLGRACIVIIRCMLARI